MATNSLRRYFDRYPERGRSAATVLARRGEEGRFQLIKSWLPDCNGLSILDVGCGDGAFLSRVLHGRPASLRLEDLVERWRWIAHARLLDASDEVTSVVADSRFAQDNKKYDVVLAFGVFDYAEDWKGLLSILLDRSKGLLMVDFPKAGTWHSRARWFWLRLHRIHLQATRHVELESLIRAMGVSADVRELPLQWVVRFKKSGG